MSSGVSGPAPLEFDPLMYFLERLDTGYIRSLGGHELKEGALPSDLFHKQVFLGFQEDGMGIKMRDIIGVDNMQCGSDYPHGGCTFPRSQEVLEDITANCTEEEQAKIAGGNTASVYDLY